MLQKKKKIHHPLLKKIIRIGKNIVLPGFEGVPLYDVIVFFIKKVQTVGLNERAAAISFNFIMAIPPACLFLFSLVPLMPWADDFSMEIMRVVNDITPNQEARRAVKDFLDDFFGRPRNSLLSFGFLIAIFYSSSAMLGIIHSFNRSIHEKEAKGFFVYRWKAIKLTFIIMILFVASMLILMTQGTMFQWIMDLLHISDNFTKIIIQLLRWIVIISLFFYSIAFIYRHAPMVEKKWKLISPGSIVACTLLILLTYLFSAWINQFGGYNKIYGSIGTLMMIMVLIYMNSLILLIGFELNVSIKSLKIHAAERRD
ncbi:MAG: YihY/virulence factor BrkB family protein [Bacteroidota bacterium]|jgi:membrane protein